MKSRWVGVAVVILCALGCVAPAEAADYTISRTTIDFGTVAVGMTNSAGFSFTATTSTPVTIKSMTLSGAGFQFAIGTFPQVMGQVGASVTYAFNFVPKAAQSYKATATFIVDGQPVIITLTGIGITTTAVATPSVTSLSFIEAQGHQSHAQYVKITNTGKSTVNILSVSTQPPFSTPPVAVTALAPGASASVAVRYFGSNVGSTTGNLLISYDVLRPTGISLQGNTMAPVNFVVTNFPTLPLGTAGSSYLARLKTAGGSGTVSWKLASGSSLPPGLTLFSGGKISGTITSTAPLSTYSFTVNAFDSQSHSASAVLSLQVLAATGAACNDINWDTPGTITPMTPISELGTGTYFGTEGGLYGNGHNVPPGQHEIDGVTWAKAIQPLDVNGNPSANGKYVLLGVGISTLLYEMQAFVPMASSDASTNSHLVIVNGGEPTASATDFANLSSPFWTTLLNNIIPNAGVTRKQVAVVMFEDVDVFPTGTYPADMAQLQSEFETIAHNMLVEFPNVKLMYYVPRFYAGYSGTFDKSSPEPYAYEQGFAIQGAIVAQINGKASLNYNPANGTVMAPWMGYGAYTWANGMIARADGLTYSCQDVRSDGRHPSVLYGAPKVAAQFLNFFKTAATTMPWFLK
jgi:HYDIN/CFA65/VesB family protein